MTQAVSIRNSGFAARRFSPSVPCRKRGFTLVELLIAATMISVLMVGLGAHLRGGLVVWQRATDSAQRAQRQRMAWDRLEQDLAGSLIYDARSDSYGAEPGQLPEPEFGSNTLSWFTVGPPSFSSSQPLPSVRFVRYHCGTVGEEAGLWRISESLSQARMREGAVPQRLLPDCARMSLRYAYRPEDVSGPIDWRDEWKAAATALPALIEVSLQMTSGQLLQRVLALPAGVLQPFESPE